MIKKFYNIFGWFAPAYWLLCFANILSDIYQPLPLFGLSASTWTMIDSGLLTFATLYLVARYLDRKN